MPQDRLDRLTAPVKERSEHNQGYSTFIRRAQLIMPVVAVIIIALVFIWSTSTKETIVPLEQADLKDQAIGKNELINPRYESRDEKNQPMTITAARAIQSDGDSDIVTLEEPKANMTLTAGDIIGAKAREGQYTQDTQKLVLNGDVELTHNAGYQLDTQQLHIDMAENKSWSDVKVYGKGPEGTLEAEGLRADSVTQDIVFLGPAKMILTSAKLGDSLKPGKK